MSAGFISEKEIQEERKKRQEEWEKVRLPEQPLEVPDEPMDHRSLFERLQEQKDKKELEWEEAHKLKNQVRGLDVEEIGFLDYVDNVKIREEKSRMKEEKELLNEFRTAVSSLKEKALEERVKEDVKRPTLTSLRNNQQNSTLLGIVRKKPEVKDADVTAIKPDAQLAAKANKSSNGSLPSNEVNVAQPLLRCVAVLPGIGTYTDSSESECGTSDSDSDSPPASKKLDLLGRSSQKKNA